MSYTDCLQDVPDIFENVIGESLNARTDGLGLIRELGPPDLCHIIKIHSSNRNEADIGSYHHVLGIDTSSSASLAAYINSLQYSLSDKQGWFGANNNWKIASGTYCTYNAFSNIDLRVQIKIPGGVDAYAINVRGERKEVTDQMWKEAYVCSLIRAILYSNPAAYSATGLRRLTPIANLREEAKFVEAVVELFWEGWRLGSNAETQMASTARNLLVDGFMKYFTDQERFADCAAEILAPLAYAPLGGQRSQQRTSMDFKGVDPEVASLLAEMYLKGDQEVQAVRVMHQALKVKPSCYPMLSAQSEFLRRKKKLNAAVTMARMAVKYAPSEFSAWARLTEIYIESNDFQRALLTLNTCPMYTFVDRDFPRVPTPRRINYPVKSDILAEYNLGENFSNSVHGPVPSNNRSSIDSEAPGIAEEMDQNEKSEILRLPAPSLKGTFAIAYNFLTQIVSTIGWDELLHLRSQAFVMEEEYKISMKPSAAVDDEEDENDDEDDQVPLSVLSQRGSTSNLPANVDALDNEAPPDISDKDAPTQDANTAQEHPSDAAISTEAVNGGVIASTEAANGEAISNTEAANGEAISSTEAANGEATITAEAANGDLDDKKENLEEDDDEADSVAKEPVNQSKSKKKNKKNKNKKAKGEPKKITEANEEAGELAQANTENKDNDASKEEQPVEKTALGEEESGDTANGVAEESTIAALSTQMDEVLLTDENKDSSENMNKPTEQSDKTAASALDSKPENTLTSPRNAVFDIKSASEQKPGPNHQSSQQDETRTIDDEAHDAEGDPTYIRKRLCERWLDNHIMILYEDLRMYTAWRYKMDNLRATGQPVMYQYTQAEWEALGELALRMHRPSDAKEAFEYALGIRFSARAWMRLLEMHTGTFADIQKEEQLRNEGSTYAFPPLNSTDSLVLALDAIVWLTVFNDRWYNNMVYPNPVCQQFIKLVRIHGLSKVRNSLVSMNLKMPVFNIVKGYLEAAEKFDVTGAKW
ncbi:bud site selection protein [Coemansia spiralis]|uniref:Bud site selection protein n=2 Tax=Coemansia TaxID=4863 RepID=A0A9W8KX45_9FUNG|nr:bud site selection protein [Coemansia umbellata]KAJ2624845.1 bud site selection protein [Coemansia sp. RSA 1358]KAJ2674355.1 bud site selection protein [Coemansia spiralis]